MDQNKLFTRIRELGHVHGKREELRDYCQQKFEQIIKFLPRRIVNSDGSDLLDCVLNGLPDNAGACRSKVKVIDVVLSTMRKETTSLTHCGEVTSRVCLELPRMPIDDLVRWSSDSVQSIVDDSDVNMIWRDILPECMSAILSHDTIKHCGTDKPSSAYKEQCIHTLCQCQWKEAQLVQLTAMFKDMQLLRAHHREVVNKICSYIMDVPPETLPPLLHQLLKLCKSEHVEVVLWQLAQYFSVRLYSKLEPPPPDSESTTVDIDDIVSHSPAELSRCLSTCLYHVAAGAADPELVRRALRQWPRTQVLRAPFVVDLALAMADKGADFRSACLEVVRAAVELRVLDELRARDAAWVRAVLAPDVDLHALFKVLTAESANHRELTVKGLIQLGFLLLGTSRLKATAPACWSLAKLILVRLAKAQPECAAHVLAQLADRLAGDASHQQYSECLYVLCKLTPVAVERCAQLGAILEACAPAPAPGDYRGAAAVLDAVHPLLNFSARSRDTLVMVCRKGLYSRDSQYRSLALSGFLSLLRHVKLSPGGGGGSSQQCSDTYSAHSYLTQLTVDLHATQQGTAVSSRVRNEAMCMEVVSILRRCLAQDASVKQLLYSNIYSCAKDKPSLHESILELLYEQLSRYLPEGEASRLLLDKCVAVTGAGAVLTEPIGHLLYAIAQFLQPGDEELEDILASQTVDTSSAHLKSKLAIILDELCSADNFVHLDMEEAGVSDLTAESRMRCLLAQQGLQCYEALAAHQLLQWSPASDAAADRLLKLFAAAQELADRAKAPSKSAKKSNKTLNESKDTIKTTQKSQRSHKSQREKGKTPAKLSALVRDRAGPFKQLPCVWDLPLCTRLLDLLYSAEVPWAAPPGRDRVRARRELHAWVLRGVQSALAQPLQRRHVARHAPQLARLLYQRCLCRFRDVCDFDEQAALLCVDVFKTCLTLLFWPNYSLKVESFLAVITGESEPSAAAHVAEMLRAVHAALSTLQEDAGADAERLHVALLQLAAFLLEQPLATNPALTDMIVKYEDYVRGSGRECAALLGGVLAAAARHQHDAPLLDELLDKLARALGRIDEEDTSDATQQSTDFSAIDSRSGHGALTTLCAHLGARARALEHVLARARDLAAARAAAPLDLRPRIEREAAELYRALVVQLCQLAAWTQRVCRLRCAVGGGSERVLGAAVRLYALLAQLARQLDPATALQVRFERLLKLSGKKLSSVTDDLITYLEGSQHAHDANKVRRDTKLIPKLVLEAETFSKQVILLSAKAQCNWQQYLSLGTARDFRIKAPVLQHALQRRHSPPAADHPDHPDSDDDAAVDINDAATEIVQQLSDAEAELDAEAEGEDDTDDRHHAARKRRRVS